MADPGALRQSAKRLPRIGIIGHQVHMLDAFCRDLLDDLDCAQRTLDRLTARHRERPPEMNPK